VDIGGTAYHALIRGNFRSRLFKKELERYLKPFPPNGEVRMTQLLFLLARR
jgi:hypothetical protein